MYAWRLLVAVLGLLVRLYTPYGVYIIRAVPPDEGDNTRNTVVSTSLYASHRAGFSIVCVGLMVYFGRACVAVKCVNCAHGPLWPGCE